jgi:hypothetical protein
VKTKLLAGPIAAILAVATGLVVFAGPGDDTDEPDQTTTIQQPEFEPSGLSEPPTPGDGDGDDGDDGSLDAAQGNETVAQAIAEEFGISPDEVLSRHNEGIGFGALFKLYALARAKGITVDELLAQIEEDGGGYGFGKLKKELTDEEQQALDDGAKNLGQLVSESKKKDKNKPD